MPAQVENPCTFKTVCKTCRWVPEIVDRPNLCIALNCEHYTACAKCGKNVSLYKDKKCASCTKEDKPKKEEKELNASLDSLPQTNGSANGNVQEQRRFSVTPPGTPPPEYSDEEKEYYHQQWKEYGGFFRDPSAYPIAHATILLELELNHLNARIIQESSSFDDGAEKKLEVLEKRRERLIKSLATLRSELPDKEAMEFTEDEMAIAAIYERFAQEQLHRKAGGISRVLSPEAIALAPVLPYKLNLLDILMKLGYQPEDYQSAIAKVRTADQLPRDPLLLLEALGMFVREKVVEIEPTKEASDFPQESKFGNLVDDPDPDASSRSSRSGKD